MDLKKRWAPKHCLFVLGVLFFGHTLFVCDTAYATAVGYSWTTTQPSANSPTSAAQVNDIQNAIRYMQGQCGQPQDTFTPVQPGDRVRFTDLSALRTKIEQLYTAKGLPITALWGTATSSNQTLGAGVQVRVGDIVSMRAALDNPALLAACGGAAACGNGTVEAGEGCDDSNTNPGDGCSAACQCEYSWVNDVCGGGTPPCLASQMHRTAADPDGAGACVAGSQCVANASCTGGDSIEWHLNGVSGARLKIDKGATTIFNQTTISGTPQSGTLTSLTGAHDITGSWYVGSGNIIKMRVCNASGTEVHYAGNIWLNPTPPPDSFSTYTTASMPSPSAPYKVYVTAGNVEPALCSGSGTTVVAFNDSYNVNLTAVEINGVSVPFPGGYPILPTGSALTTTMSLASPTVMVHVIWSGSDLAGQSITVTDTLGNAQCTTVQVGNPDPQFTITGVNTTGAGNIRVALGPSPCSGGACNNNGVCEAGETCSSCISDCNTCGDGCITPPLEQCEPPNTSYCDASCLSTSACHLFTGWAVCPGSQCCVPDPGNPGYEMCTSTCGTACLSNGDCDDSNACTVDTCQGSVCYHNSVPQSCGDGCLTAPETCDLGPPSSNNGACPKLCSATCATQTCSGATCSDGIQNGQETGIDSCDDSDACTTDTCSGAAICTNTGIAPPAPTGLSASAAVPPYCSLGGRYIDLSWTASCATTYNILRSTTSGSGYVSVATGVTGTSYRDASAIVYNTTYYYVVQAVNAVSTSGNSNQASAVGPHQCNVHLSPSYNHTLNLQSFSGFTQPAPVTTNWDGFHVGSYTGNITASYSVVAGPPSSVIILVNGVSVGCSPLINPPASGTYSASVNIGDADTISVDSLLEPGSCH